LILLYLLLYFNDSDAHLRKVADYLARLKPVTAYLSIPTRPPAEAWVQPPGEDAVTRAYQVFGEKMVHVEYLIGYEGNSFAFTGNAEEDLLSITAVHPMREKAVSELLARAGANWSVVDRLISQNQLVEIEFEGHTFYLRKFGKRNEGRRPC
jgi:wyosine [tRNA(Phe)-imidazoG37] synthetase (radical SAM superfamily)